MSDDIPDQTPESSPKADKDQGTITAIYGALCASVVLQFMPNESAMVISGLLLLATWTAIGHFRRKAGREGLLSNHMSFLNVTLWVWLLLVNVAMVVAAAYIFTRYDMNAISALAQDYLAGNTDNETIRTLKTVAIAAGVPCYTYIIWRLAKGLNRALRGYRIAHPKRWF